MAKYIGSLKILFYIYLACLTVLTYYFIGATMEDLLGRLLSLRCCKYIPRHKNNLANEFRCFANYNLDAFMANKCCNWMIKSGHSYQVLLLLIIPKVIKASILFVYWNFNQTYRKTLFEMSHRDSNNFLQYIRYCEKKIFLNKVETIIIYDNEKQMYDC